MKNKKLIPIASDGWKFVIGFGILGVLLFSFSLMGTSLS